MVRLLEVASGAGEEIKFVAAKKISTFAWSPDGRLLASGDEEGVLRLWDVFTGREVRRFTGHHGEVTTLAFSPDGLRLASGSRDTTALVWNLRGLVQPEVRSMQSRKTEDMWVALRKNNSTEAWQTMYELIQNPDEALPLLRERLRPTTTMPDQKIVATLLTQLDDDNFQIRKRAVEQLVKMGERIEPDLREALTKKPSLEARENINKVLLEVLGLPVGPSSLNAGQLRACRAVEVLERIGTPAAREVLEELSRLPTGLVQAEEAKAALQRVIKSAPSP